MASLLLAACAESQEQPASASVAKETPDQSGRQGCDPYEVFSLPTEPAELYLHWELPDTENRRLTILDPEEQEPLHVIEVPAEMQDFYSSRSVRSGQGWALGYYHEAADNYEIPFFVDLKTGEVFRLPKLDFNGVVNAEGTMLVAVPAEAGDLEGDPVTAAYGLPCGGIIAGYDIRDDLEQYTSSGLSFTIIHYPRTARVIAKYASCGTYSGMLFPDPSA